MHMFMIILMAGLALRPVMREGWWGLEWIAVTTLILLVSILFHELAHCWMAIRLGGGAESILIWPLGGLATVHHGGSPQEQIKVSGIGPLSSFVLGLVCLATLLLSGAEWRWDYINPFGWWWWGDLTTFQNFILHAVLLNLYLGLFNLCIPAYPLDGGQILFAFLTIRSGRRRAAEITSVMAIVAGGFLHHKSAVRSGDELETLAQAFNRMTGDLAVAQEQETICVPH